jgi:type IV secretory pathway protease TraF
MSEFHSPYYPPRSRWYRRAFDGTYRIRRALHLGNIHLPRLITTPTRFVLALAVPGYSFVDAGWRRVGLWMAGAWCCLALIFIVWLGYAVAGLAFGIMISLHVSSVLHALNRMTPGASIWWRLLLSVAVLIIVGQLVYASGLDLLQSRLLMPLRAGDKVVIVRPITVTAPLRRGELVACATGGTFVRGEPGGGRGIFGNVNIRGGHFLDRVLAGPGDRVEFTPTECRVNGTATARLPLMPATGVVVVPEKTWFVWPTLHTVTWQKVSSEVVGGAVLDIALVQREQVIGRPFKRWFWRKQTS